MKNQKIVQFILKAAIFLVLVQPAHALEFAFVGNGGNCTGCEWISASGLVKKGDAEKFEAFTDDGEDGIRPYRQHNLIMFDSKGGSLSGGIALGKKIRQLGFAVGIGKSTPVPDSSFANLDDGICISACAYAFLGGKYRYTGDDNNCLGFHQFFDKSAIKRADKDGALSTQESTQIISGIIVEYLTSIEAPLDIYTFASKFTGTEFGCINKDPLLNAKIDNSKFEFTQAKLLPYGKGMVAEILANDDGRSMRLYCMKGGKALIAYFLQDDLVDTYNDLLADSGANISGLRFNANGVVIKPSLELVQLIADGAKTAIVFGVNQKFIASAFEAGAIDTSNSDTGRAQQSWFNAFNFTINGSKKIPNLISRNCIG